MTELKNGDRVTFPSIEGRYVWSIFDTDGNATVEYGDGLLARVPRDELTKIGDPIEIGSVLEEHEMSGLPVGAIVSDQDGDIVVKSETSRYRAAGCYGSKDEDWLAYPVVVLYKPPAD